MNNAEFGPELRHARQAAERTLKDVADHMGWSIPYLSDIERGRRNPPATDHVRTIATYLSCEEKGDELVDLAVAYQGEIRMSGTDAETRRVLVTLDRRIQSGGLSGDQIDKLLKILNEERRSG